MDNRKRLPTPATVAPVPGTLRLDDRGSRGPVREGAPGGAAQGAGAPPHAKERPRRGPEAGGCSLFGPLGGPDIGIPACAADAYRR